MLLIAALTLLGVVLALLNPWPLKLIVDNVLAKKPLPEGVELIQSLPGADSPRFLLAWLAGATVGLFLITRLITILQRYVEAGAGSRMMYSLASDLFRHLQRRSLLLHYQDRTGDLIKRVTSDCGCVRQLVMQVVVPGATAFLTLVAMFLVMWQLSRGLALFALVL